MSPIKIGSSGKPLIVKLNFSNPTKRKEEIDQYAPQPGDILLFEVIGHCSNG